MSLRTDVHAAFDGIAPTTGGMAERIVESARAQARIQNRRRRFMLRMRAPLALVAALLLIAIIAALVVGGRLWQSWSAPHTPIHAGASLPTLQELEARPWQHQLLAAGDTCSGEGFIGSHIGSGPIYSYPQSLTSDAWGEYSTGENILDPGFSGLLLVRLRDARTGQHNVFIGPTAGGQVLGTDTLQGETVEHHPEAVFDMSDPAIKVINDKKQKSFPIREGHRLPISGCFEWQYDGTYKGRPFIWHWYFSG